MDIHKLNLTLADIEVQLLHRLALAESMDEMDYEDEMDGEDDCGCGDPECEGDCEDEMGDEEEED